MLGIDEVKAVLKPQFGGFLAKSSGEVLWIHNLILWSIASRIMKFIPRFDDRERRLLEIMVLIHDIGKMSPKNQSILSGAATGRVAHTQTKEQIKKYFEDNGLTALLALDDADINFIYHAHLHHNLPEDALKTSPQSLAVYADIVRYADWLASQERLDRRLLQRISGSLEEFCQITAVTISRPEGPSNYLLFDIAWNRFKEKGWDVLIVLSNALVLIAPKGTLYPEKAEVVRRFREKLIKESLSLQKPIITNFASVFLAGESAKRPGLYIDIHKDAFNDALGYFDHRAPSYFFKLLVEMLDISGRLTSEIKEKYPILDVLKGLCGTRGIPIAKNKWLAMGGKATEWKEILKEMFNNITLDETMPPELHNSKDSARVLKNIPFNELYDILYRLAEKLFPSGADTVFENELHSLISMEEEADFREIAIKRFKSYKEYKETQRPDKVCESCGFPIAFPTQKSLNFPGGKRWGFSQISAHTDSARATCTLCAYDTMVFRKDIFESRSPIYVRIESKTSDIWRLYDEISKLIQKLDAAFYNPYALETLGKSGEYGFLPLPKDFKMPKIKEPKQFHQPLSSIRGHIIPIFRPVDSSVSPKDLRAKYYSLYALLKIMGFDSHIGFEEQTGLFGYTSIANLGDKYDNLYYRGLAIKYLANFLGGEKREKQNAHVLAESLLVKSPSVAISQIGEASAEKKLQKKVSTERISQIIETIVKGNFKIRKKNGGEYTMKELLRDAAFFAEGIPTFIWDKEHNIWNEALRKKQTPSKHLITKSISKTMDSILQGDDFEDAFAKFLLIRENISKDKTKEGIEKPTVDVNDLAVFVSKAKEILQRYYDLRQEDISAFIQAKNALLSSVYLLKRYPNIKEVVNG